MLDDFVGDGENGFLAQGNGADEAATVANLLAEEGAGFGVDAGFSDHVLVEVVDAEAGNVFAGEVGRPLAEFVFFDDDIGEDVGVSGGVEFTSGIGRESADILGGSGDALDADSEGFRDLWVASPGEVLEVLPDDEVFVGGGAVEALELDEEGLRDAGGSHAGGFEVFDQGEGLAEVGEGVV